MPSFDVGVSGITPGVTVLYPDGTVRNARTTVGVTEPVAGSGTYFFPHPSPGQWLVFVIDTGVGMEGCSTFDDGRSPQETMQAAIAATPVMLSLDQPYYAPTTWRDLIPLALEESVQAVKAKTDNLPASPAATGDAMTLTPEERASVVAAVWSATTRTLTSFGSLVSDIWSYVTRSLTDKTDFSLTAEYDPAKTAAQESTLQEVKDLLSPGSGL